MQAERDQLTGDEWAGITYLFGLVRRHPYLFAGLTAVCALFGFAASTVVAPQFESSIYLGLEDWRSQNPVLEGLQIPGGTQDTKDAYSVLRSQEVLGLVVTGAEAGPESFRMGLTTQVLEQPKSPWQRLEDLIKRRGRGDALRAQFAAEPSPKGADWTLYFETDEVVWVAPSEDTTGPVQRAFGPGLGARAQRFVLGDEGLIEFQGLQANLSRGLGRAGRTFRLRARTREQAIADLRHNLVLQLPTERNQVVRLVVRDSQPEPAQELAQALTAAFLFHEQARNTASAQSVVSYLDTELAQRSLELEALDQTIQTARSQNTDLLNPEIAAASLRLQSEAVSAQKLANQSTLVALEAAVADLQSDRQAGVGAVREYIEDPRFGRWIDQIDEIEAKLDAGFDASNHPLQVGLQEDWQAARLALRAAQRRVSEYDRNLQEFRAGDDSRITALLELLTLPGSPPPTGLLDSEVTPYRQAQTDLASALSTYTEKHGAVEIARQWLVNRRNSLLGAFDSQLQLLQDAVGHRAEECQLLEFQLKLWPKETLENAIQAKLALWQKVRTALSAELGRCKAKATELDAQSAEINARLLRLPSDSNALALPELEREGLRSKIDLLLKKRDDAKIALAGLRPTAKVLEPAIEPTARQPHLSLLGFLVGSLVGWMMALTLAQFLNARKRGEQTHNQKLLQQLPNLELPVLARMPQRAGEHQFAQGHPLACDLKGASFAALRRLRVQLNLLGQRGWNTRLVGVLGLESFKVQTAPNESDGLLVDHGLVSLASATVAGLALTHTLAGRRVVIVDADLTSANLSGNLGLAAYPGLSECLLEESKWQACLVTAGPSKLEILPAGGPPENLANVYGAPTWNRLLKDLGERFDVVLVLLPSLYRATDFERLAPKLGSVLLVLDPRETPVAGEFSRLLAPLRRSGTRLIGTFQANRGHADSSESGESGDEEVAVA